MSERTDYSFDHVFEVNHSWIHHADGSRRWSIMATEERLKDVYERASALQVFYLGMTKCLTEEYNKRHDELEKISRFYTPEEIEEARDWKTYGITEEQRRIHHNEEERIRWNKLFGFGDARSFAYENYEKYRKLTAQAKNALLLK